MWLTCTVELSLSCSRIQGISSPFKSSPSPQPRSILPPARHTKHAHRSTPHFGNAEVMNPRLIDRHSLPRLAIQRSLPVRLATRKTPEQGPPIPACNLRATGASVSDSRNHTITATGEPSNPQYRRRSRDPGKRQDLALSFLYDSTGQTEEHGRAWQCFNAGDHPALLLVFRLTPALSSPSI